MKALPIKWTMSVGLAVCLLIYILRLDTVAGAFIDDAWFILHAKALATGHGFTLINSPSMGAMPYYRHAPFVALLSLVFRAVPHFPSNVLFMKAVSITAIMLAGRLTYYYFAVVKESTPRFAAAMTIATLLTPGIVFLATSTVMSESFFIFLQTLTIVLVERSLRTHNGRNGWFLLLAASASAAVAFLTRSIAISVFAAALISLVINKQLLKALCFSSAFSLILIPWLVYSNYYAPGAAQISDLKAITLSYTSQSFTKATGSDGQPFVLWTSLLRRATTNLKEIGERDIGGILVPSLYRAPAESGQEVFGMEGAMGMSTDTIVVSLILSGLCLWGFIVATRRSLGVAELTVFLSLLMILSFPSWPFRYLLPLAPFLIFYTLEGIKALLAPWMRFAMRAGQDNDKHSGRIAGIFLLFIISLNLYDHAAYLLCKFHVAKARVGWIERYEEAKQLLEWVSSNVDPTTLVATENAALVNLYTGLRTVQDLDPVSDRDELRREGAKLFVHISPYFESSVLLDDPRFHVLCYTKQSNFYVLSLDQ